MKILGFQKTTLLDYPEHIASIVFTGGCNFYCPYCHNSELIHPKADAPLVSEEEILSHLTAQKGKIEGLVISGGEPTLQPDLAEFCKKIKDLGLLVKLDTNGTAPEILAKLIDEQLIDYVAMDAKMPSALYSIIMPKDAPEEVTKKHTDAYKKSLALLKSAPGNIDYEIRTTVVGDFFDTDIVTALGHELSGVRRLFLQPFKNGDTVPVSGLREPSAQEMESYKDILSEFIPQVELRGM